MKKNMIKVSVFFALLVSMSCVEQNTASKQAERKLKSVNSLMKKQPSPTVEYSMERAILSERIKRFNDPNKMSYLYIVLPEGTWLQVTIIGKLASTSKRLTRLEERVDIGEYISAPDEMGTYGNSSGGGKVGMTTLGSLIEMGGFMSYIYSETPLTFKNLNRPFVELTVNVSDSEKKELLQNLENYKAGVK